MNNLKVFESLLYLGIGFSVFYALHHYVFDDGDYGFFWFLFPVGTSIFGLISEYYDIKTRKNKRDFIVLKDSPFVLRYFNGAILSAIIIFYIQDSFLYWLTPILLIDLILIYLIKRRQIYYFGDWSIKNLSRTGNNILIKEIQSYILHPNKLEIVYSGKDDDDDEDDEDDLEIKRLVIRRDQLELPRSWHEFEKIAQEFKEKIDSKTS